MQMVKVTMSLFVTVKCHYRVPKLVEFTNLAKIGLEAWYVLYQLYQDWSRNQPIFTNRAIT